MTTKTTTKQGIEIVRDAAGTFIQGEWRWYRRPHPRPRVLDVESRHTPNFASRVLFNTLWRYEAKNEPFRIEICEVC